MGSFKKHSPSTPREIGGSTSLETREATLSRRQVTSLSGADSPASALLDQSVHYLWRQAHLGCVRATGVVQKPDVEHFYAAQARHALAALTIHGISHHQATSEEA